MTREYTLNLVDMTVMLICDIKEKTGTQILWETAVDVIEAGSLLGIVSFFGESEEAGVAPLIAEIIRQWRGGASVVTIVKAMVLRASIADMQLFFRRSRQRGQIVTNANAFYNYYTMTKAFGRFSK